MQKTLAPDGAYVLDTIRRYLITKGIPLDHLGPLAFGVAMDARIQVQQRTATPCLYGLDLLPIQTVDTVPRGEDGRDLQGAELFPVDAPTLLDAAEAYLAGMDAEDGAG